MEKTEIRKQMKSVLSKISFQDRQEMSRLIFENLFKTADFENADSIFVFNSMNSEPMTDDIIKYCLDNGKHIFVPKISNAEMRTAEIFKDTKYKLNHYGIAEPLGENFKNYFDIDINIIPLVAFDSKCNRLGHGKGYYDKYLKNAEGLKIGLAFECQRIENVPIETHDIPLDYIITEKKIYQNK